MSKYGEKAAELNKSGYNCAQSVFVAYAEDQGMDRELAAQISGNLGTGCREGCSCGALNGALMALGFYCGHAKAEDGAAKSRAFNVSIDFVKKFKTVHGTTQCRELLGGNPSIPEERKRLAAEGKLSTICPKLTVSAAELLEEYIKEIQANED